MKVSLYSHLCTIFHGSSDIPYESWDNHFANKFRYYVTDNPDLIRTMDNGLYTVKASSKWEDGFLGDIFAEPIGDELFIAQMDLRQARHVRWHLKMIKNGWETIPKELYGKIVEV